MRIEVVDGAAGRDRFIRLPWAIYADDPHWIPPLRAERRDHLNAKRNPYFDHAEVRLWLATRGGRAVGRISAQVDQAHLARHRDDTGHFGFLEAEDDAETFAVLLGAAEDWLREKGMRRIRGPFSLSINDESGLLVDGFDTPPSLMMGHARPYYAARIEERGYVKAMDLIAYDYAMTQEIPPPARSLADRVRQSPNVRLRPLRGAHYREDLAIILDIFNDAWSENWGFVPLSEAEIARAAKDMKLLIREEYVCIAEVDGAPAAMAVSLLNLNEAIADLDGSLFPLGWAKLLWRLKTDSLRTARMPLMGVRKAFHATALGTALAFAVIDEIHRNHLRAGRVHGELSWILENNLPMRRMIEAVGGRPYKTYRVFEKELG